jgi:hypothetical protein
LMKFFKFNFLFAQNFSSFFLFQFIDWFCAHSRNSLMAAWCRKGNSIYWLECSAINFIWVSQNY